MLAPSPATGSQRLGTHFFPQNSFLLSSLILTKHYARWTDYVVLIARAPDGSAAEATLRVEITVEPWLASNWPIVVGGGAVGRSIFVLDGDRALDALRNQVVSVVLLGNLTRDTTRVFAESAARAA